MRLRYNALTRMVSGQPNLEITDKVDLEILKIIPKKAVAFKSPIVFNSEGGLKSTFIYYFAIITFFYLLSMCSFAFKFATFHLFIWPYQCIPSLMITKLEWPISLFLAFSPKERSGQEEDLDLVSPRTQAKTNDKENYGPLQDHFFTKGSNPQRVKKGEINLIRSLHRYTVFSSFLTL